MVAGEYRLFSLLKCGYSKEVDGCNGHTAL